MADLSPYGDLPPAPWETDYWTDPVPVPADAAPLPDPAGVPAGPTPEPVTPSVDLGPSAPTAPYDATGAPVAGPSPDPGINPPLFETGLIDNPYAPPPLPEAAGAPPPFPYGAAPAAEVAPALSLPGGAPAGELAPASAFGPQLPPPVPAAPAPPGPPTIDVTSKDPFAGMSDAEAFAAARDLATTDGAAFDQLQRTREATKLAKAEADRFRAEDENLQKLKDNVEARRLADEKTQIQQDAITKDAIELSKRPIDRRRYFKNQSVIGNIAAAIATIAGGLASRGGGPNMGLDYLNKLIDDDINDQKADIENERGGIQARQNAVAQEFARTGNLYQAAETVRQATYLSVIAKLQAQQQNYDPRGQGYIEHGNYIQAARAKAAAAKEAARKTQFDENLKTIKADQDAARIKADKAKAKADQSLAWSRLGLDKKEFDYKKVHDREELDVRKAEAAATREAKRAERQHELSIGSLPRVQVDEKGVPVTNEKGVPVIETGELRQKDGSVFLAPDKEARKKLADQFVAASSINDIINQVLDIRERVGGESGIMNSDDLQRLQVLERRLGVLAKQGTEGMSSDADMENLRGSLGAKDISSFRERSAGLAEGRDNTTTAINKALRVANYTGPAITFPNPYTKGPEESSEDVADRVLLQKPAAGDGAKSERAVFAKEVASELSRAAAGLSPEEQKAFGRPILEDEMREHVGYDAKGKVGTSLSLTPAQQAVFNDVAAKFDPGATLEQQRAIADLRSSAVGDGDTALAARQRLQNVANKAHTPRLRQLALQALGDAINADVLSRGEPETVR